MAAYALFLRIGLDSGCAAAMLPTFLLAGLGFGRSFGPLNIAVTSGIAAEEQGWPEGLINTSFQFGGALALAVVTAVNNAYTVRAGTAQALLDGFRPAIVVSVIVAALGVLAMAVRLPTRSVPAEVEPGPEVEAEVEVEAEAA